MGALEARRPSPWVTDELCARAHTVCVTPCKFNDCEGKKDKRNFSV